MLNQEDRQVIKILWSMVSKVADRSRRQTQEIIREPVALIRCSYKDQMIQVAGEFLDTIQ